MAQPTYGGLPPTRDGVGPSCVALPSADWRLLIDFLAHRFPAIPREVWTQRMAQGAVLDAAGMPLPCTTAYRSQSKIYYYRSLSDEAPIPFEASILFQDETLIVCDKPHFLPVIPSGRYLQQTLLVRLKRQLGIETLAPVHRIDRETAGLVLFTVTTGARAAFQALFRERQVHKTYHAIARWRPELSFPIEVQNRLEDAEAFMQMRVVDGIPNAATTIDVESVQGDLARYRLCPRTGQRHQLRVQMAALGMPILNDRIYPILLPELAQNAAPDYSNPLQLLARSIEFIDPITGQSRHFESRLRLQF